MLRKRIIQAGLCSLEKIPESVTVGYHATLPSNCAKP